MKRLLFAVFINMALCFIHSLYCANAAEEIVVLGNDAKPPKYYLENGQPRGILVDIMKYVDQQMPESFIYKLSPWKRAYEHALLGKGGIIGLSKTEERLQLFDYSEVMYYDEIVLVVLEGNEFQYDSIEDLQGKRVGVQRGSSYGDEFESAKKTFTADLDSGVEQRLLKLLANRIDIAFIGPGVAGLNAAVEKNEILKNNKGRFVVLPKPFKKDPNYLGFAKTMGKQLFLNQFNRALSEGWQNGAIQRIINNHPN